MADLSFSSQDPGSAPSQSSVPTSPEPILPYTRDDATSPLAAFPEYEFLNELGRGGMGVVHLARNRLLDRLEAVKVMTHSWSEVRFRQEVRAAARLSHPNVVTAYAALVKDGLLAFAMEYVEGQNLARLVRGTGPLSPALACAYTRQAALGLQHAHERGMIHRDVKPQNLMLTPTGTVKILDFGLAKGADTEDNAGAITIDGQVLGTLGYAAPEQVRNPRAADIRSDIYSLGVTLWFLLTGDHPTEDGAPDASRAPRSGWPKRLAAVLARMTAWNPAERYQTPAEVAAALEPFAATSSEASPPGGTPRRSSSNRWRSAGAAAAVVLVAAVGAGALRWQGDSPVTEPHNPPVVSPSPSAHPADNRFTPIFNGSDLSGWVVDGAAGQWRVEDGAIVTTGVRGETPSWLLSERDYGDMRVRFEYQLEPGGNSGFVFRAVPGERPVLRPGGLPTPHAYHQQMELSDDSVKEWNWLPTGQISGGSGKAAPMLKPIRPARLQPPGEWNAVEIELVGQSLKVTLNGEQIQAADLGELVSRGSIFPALTRSRGRIGFQQFFKTVRFQKVEVLELPESNGQATRP